MYPALPAARSGRDTHFGENNIGGLQHGCKNFDRTVIGAVGGAIASIFGGWDAAMTTLIIFMCIDYLSGLIVAGVFHASRKTDSGALESRAGWKGLCRKGMILLIVLIAYRLDLRLV